jgi:LPPG:FO 2-phospho-L-lactate transferase
MGVRPRVLPMSDDPVATMLETVSGRLSFQEYFVRERHAVEVSKVEFVGAAEARPAPGVLDAIAGAKAIIFAPSNPVTSIGPILAVPGIRDAMVRTQAPVAAVSPFIGNAAVSGPAAELMRLAGGSGTTAGLANLYGDFLSVLIADNSDLADSAKLMLADVQIRHTNILMKTFEDKCSLARFVLQAASQSATGARA